MQMKISLTGCSSTGKTTLARTLMQQPKFRCCASRFLSVDGRQILDDMQVKSMDKMSREQQRRYQMEYFNKKMSIEVQQHDFITDRSFVDVAAYWTVRDTFDKSKDDQDVLVAPCRKFARLYDFTFYLPYGVIAFEDDGYRPESTEFNQMIDRKIRYFLRKWDIRYCVLNMAPLSQRIAAVFDFIEMNS
jgi:nicotinamide riboside kinase